MRNARAKFCKTQASECGRSGVRTGLPAITKVLACCANQSGAQGQHQPIMAQDTAALSVGLSLKSPVCDVSRAGL